MKHVNRDVTDDPAAQVVMPVSELHGRTVWTEAGERIGVVRGVQQDDDGRVVALDVRDRWLLGPHHEVPAAGMRIDSGDVIVPSNAVPLDRDDGERRVRSTERRRTVANVAPAPVFLAGREGARGRFGGLDLIGSLFGALVAIACLVLVGGLLAAAFGAEPAAFDTSLDSIEAITSEALLVAAVTLFLSCFIGGWAAGRSARFDGVANGVMTVVWVLGIGVALGAAGAWFGDEYDVFASVDLPSFQTDEFALWGSVAFAAALVLMLVGGAIGGALGESWHRRADRAMLDVVAVDDDQVGRPSAGIVGSTADDDVLVDSTVDDSDAITHDRSSRPPR